MKSNNGQIINHALAQVYYPLKDRIEDQVDNQVWDQVWDQVRDEVYDQVFVYVRTPIKISLS